MDHALAVVYLERLSVLQAHGQDDPPGERGRYGVKLAPDEGERSTEGMMQGDKIADALRGTLISPNVPDDNLEAANVVDALAMIARAINRLAVAVDNHRFGPQGPPSGPRTM